MVVYVDFVFVLNALIDYLLLLGCARLGGESVRRMRLIGAAVLGGVYAVGCALPQLALLQSLPVYLAVLAGMVVLAFGASRRTLWLSLLLLALGFLLGGCLTTLALLLDVRVRILGGAVCYVLDLPTLVLVAGLVYAVTALCFAGVGGHSGGDLIPVEATLAGRTVHFTALRDTGNTLRDPITGRSVLVAEAELVCGLLPRAAADSITGSALANPAQTMQRCMQLCPQLHLRLIPYRAVGVQSAMLLAVRCDEIKLGKHVERNGLIALSPTTVSDGGAYRALAGGN